MNETLRTRTLPAGRLLEIVQGDITLEQVGAIVNPANAQLAHGGGLAAVISRVGGATIDRESREWVQTHGPVPHRRPAVTSGGDLPAPYVIHAVGPVWGSGDEDAKLAEAVRGSLERADELGLASIALPAISTGIFGFPIMRAAGVIYAAIEAFFSDLPESGLQLVRVVLFDQPSVEAFVSVFDRAETA
jgi:O-acetyl-ADP-ribose deacetylase (regulator of RNase III)